MKRKLIFTGLALLLSVVVLVSSCGGKSGNAASAAARSGSSVIRATWVKPEINGDSVFLSLNEVQKYGMVHFKLSTVSGDEAYMAYIYGGVQYVRANICPPCRSEGFSLVKNTLVCDTCGTVFDAKSGSGISGACVRYPKASVVYKVSSGRMVMNISDLEAAFQKTLIPKQP